MFIDFCIKGVKISFSYRLAGKNNNMSLIKMLLFTVVFIVGLLFFGRFFF
jgi:uncharacterized membrane protein YciS (DUF1049 family)